MGRDCSPDLGMGDGTNGSPGQLGLGPGGLVFAAWICQSFGLLLT